MLELTPEILAQLEATSGTSGEHRLVVRGRDTDIATLMDLEDKAYELHTAHTSNNLYLFAKGDTSYELKAKLNQTWELQPTYPQIRARLKEVLAWDERGAFRGIEFEQMLDDTKEPRRVTGETLQRHVQASTNLCVKVLAEIPAFRESASGHWRVLDSGYCMDLLRLVLATQVERGWPLDTVDSQVAFDALRSEPGNEQLLFEAVDAVLARFGTRSAPTVYAVDGIKVAKYLAEQIFVAEQMRPWPATEFLKAMHAAMPPHLVDSIGTPEHWSSKSIPESIVREMAYVTAGAESQMLHTTHGVTYRSVTLNPLFRSTLPHEPRLRMQKLFGVKSKWARSEIVPFLEDLVDVDPDLLAKGDEAAKAVLKKAIDGWLIKFGRGVSGPSGEMVYSSRLN
ncbi:Sister chromatid cohesion protein DCC1 [Linderina macrospora]|uniref:Sister chromatid cohesion protein DCC1 n=1 Tax=Linderina macrospora TaxID=4868 RepID=A0ACC1JDR6_9FUNG|nr:Sister chromatid cohesion protein DCC1 [Linderina macrospora]